MIDKQYDFTEAANYQFGSFPPATLDYESLLGPLLDATAMLARYDARMSGLINSHLLLAPLMRQDAVVSSRMEGTISSIEDVYRLEAEEDTTQSNIDRDIRHDDIETWLYSRAMHDAQVALEDGMPLGEYLIKATHQKLLSIGRGASKHAGQYKIEQNYIGDLRNGRISFVPIAPEHLAPAMENLVLFINNTAMPPLVRTAIVHAEFEALHPFVDGNGRIGRMLITLMLWKLGILSRPYFFLSGYFEKHRDEYLERLREVSASEDWNGWVAFFLRALAEQAGVNVKLAEEIHTLYLDMRERFHEVLRSKYHDQALDFVFASPIFRNDRLIHSTDIPPASARSFTRRLTATELLRVLIPPSGRRPGMYAFDPLLDLLKV